MSAPMNLTQNASLYVGDLDGSVVESDLYDKFSPIGPIGSVRLCRDSVTKKSLGYAYVNFQSPLDASTAREKLNYTDLKGRAIRISPAIRDPTIRKTNKGNIIVKNLPKNFSHLDLYDTFSSAGDIISAKVASNNGQLLNYGFVQYMDEESAKKAISLLNNKKCGISDDEKTATIIKIEPYIGKDLRTQTFTNLFVKNIPRDWDTKRLNEEFSKFGKITSALVSTDAENVSKGFGFVNFSNHQEAEHAINEMHDKDLGVIIDNKKALLYVQRHQTKSERNRNKEMEKSRRNAENRRKARDCNLYVKNFSPVLNDDGLRALFQPYGQITSARIMRDKEGNSRGFGFVCFANPDQATDALNKMNNTILDHRPLYVSLAQLKDERSNMLQKQHTNRISYPYYQQHPPMNQMRGYRGQGFPMYPPQIHGNYMMALSRGGGNNQPRAHMQMRNHRPIQQSMKQNQQKQVAKRNLIDLPIEEFVKEIVKEISNTDTDALKNMLGEKLYHLVHRIVQDEAPKITGMLLELEPADIIALLENQSELESKCKEAQDVLNKSQNQ